MYGIFWIQGGCVVVENGIVDAICAYEGAEDAADAFCMRHGLEIHAYHMVCGWDEAEDKLEDWRESLPAFMS